MHSILLISRSRSLLLFVKDILEHENYIVHTVSDTEQGLSLLKNRSKKISVVFYDFSEDDYPSFQTLFSDNSITVPFLIFSEQDNPRLVEFKSKSRIKGVVMKPAKIHEMLEQLRLVLQEVDENPKSSSCLDMIIGNSPQIEHVKKMIRVLANNRARVLVTGENGTGKELVAKCLHSLSARHGKDMVEVNCAAIPKELIESELFGHEKGSFTSAISQRKGKFELANGSTIFLDEIGDMSLSAQAKILRVLQENKITRVGGSGEISLDVRVIAATNKNLQKDIKDGYFREDLYHRLCIMEIYVPSLNERLSDVPLLAEHFMKDICEREKCECKPFEPEALDLLQNRLWSGNVRELRNMTERLAAFSGDSITADDVNTYVIKKMVYGI